jgi:hypothetical protein
LTSLFAGLTGSTSSRRCSVPVSHSRSIGSPSAFCRCAVAASSRWTSPRGRV